MRRHSAPSPTHPRLQASQELGFSVIEVLVAAALLLMIAIGVIPLFTRAMMSNLEGNESTQASTFAIWELEDSRALPLADPRWVVPPGSPQLFTDEFFDTTLDTWVPDPPGDASQIRWRREITVEQYSLGDLFDNQRLDTPLDGSTDPAQVQLKLMTVDIFNPRLEERRMMVGRFLKSVDK